MCIVLINIYDVNQNFYNSLVLKTTLNNNTIADIRLRLRCAIPPPRSRPIGRIACARKFLEYYLRVLGILNDPFCSERLNDPFCMQQTRPRRCSEDCQCFEWSGQPQKIAAFPWGNLHPRLIMVPSAHPSPLPKRYFDRFSRFAHLTVDSVECSTTSQWAAKFSQKNVICPCEMPPPHLTHPPESSSQTASRSV